MVYFYAATTLASGAEVVCATYDGRSYAQLHRLMFPSLQTLLQLSTTLPRKSLINTVSVSLSLSLRKSMTPPFLALFSTLSLVSFFKPDWNQSKR